MATLQDKLRRWKENAKDLAVCAAVVAGIGALVTIPVAQHFSRDTYGVTITDKQTKRYNNSDKYIVFTKLPDGNVRVFENTDSPLELKWNSSDIQGKLEVGQKYRIKAYGWRVPFFSWYENIVDVQNEK